MNKSFPMRRSLDKDQPPGPAMSRGQQARGGRSSALVIVSQETQYDPGMIFGS